MNIIEATQKALECNGYITKLYDGDIWVSALKPTNSHDCYICFSAVRSNKPARCWNPTADDILSNEWEVITEKTLSKQRELLRPLSDRLQNDVRKQQ